MCCAHNPMTGPAMAYSRWLTAGGDRVLPEHAKGRLLEPTSAGGVLVLVSPRVGYDV